MSEEKNVMMMEITVDDGAVKVPIKNQLNEEIGLFYFHPTDIGIIDRYNRMIDKFDDVVEPLSRVSITPEGTVKEDGFNTEDVEALQEAQNRLYAVLNEMFGGNMAEAFFGKMHPFSPVGGRFYCENAIEAVGNFISKQFEKETASMSKKVEKYTKGYAKKGKK